MINIPKPLAEKSKKCVMSKNVNVLPEIIHVNADPETLNESIRNWIESSSYNKKKHLIHILSCIFSNNFRNII